MPDASSAAVVVAEPEAPEAATRPRRDVYVELLVTVGLFAIPAILNSVFGYVGKGFSYGTRGLGWMFAGKVAQEMLFVGLFFYVLHANRERLADFTRPLALNDVRRSLGLLLVSWLPYAVVMLALWYWALFGGQIDLSRNMPLPRTLSLPFIALLLVNPFCEELWMRAFLQTRLGQLGWSTPVIVLTSACSQAAYHLYQGVPFALGYVVFFGILAAYYQRTRRLWPVVGVHLIADVAAGIYYALPR